MINTLEPTLSAELIATLAVGAIWVALLVVQRYETRRNIRALRAETRAGIQGLREDLRADFKGLRQEVHQNFQNFRTDLRSDSAHVRGNLAGLRKDIQALTVRMARIEGLLVGYFAARNRHDDAA